MIYWRHFNDIILMVVFAIKSAGHLLPGPCITILIELWMSLPPLAWTGQKLLKKCPKNRNIFLVPLNIPELVSREIFLIRVRLPGGAAIIFAQSWNFELKFFVDNPFMKKTTLQVWEVIFCPKMGQKNRISFMDGP